MATASRIAWGSASAGCAFASLYCFFWIFSAASLASGACPEFSQFAEAWRCRQVHVAMILTATFGLGCIYLGWRAIPRTAP